MDSEERMYNTPMTRSDFLKMAGGTAATLAFSSLMPGCTGMQLNKPACKRKGAFSLPTAASLTCNRGV